MNVSFSRGDKTENVNENYRRIAAALGCTPEDFVFFRSDAYYQYPPCYRSG
ncbi:MAG: laccase domain-containing protein [Eisenbergiella sp.]